MKKQFLVLVVEMESDSLVPLSLTVQIHTHRITYTHTQRGPMHLTRDQSNEQTFSIQILEVEMRVGVKVTLPSEFICYVMYRLAPC